jgi:hypothetical protein
MGRLRNLVLVLLALLGLAQSASAAPAYVGGEADKRYSSFALIAGTYTATAGNFLFIHVAGNDYGGAATCNTPSGWTVAEAGSAAGGQFMRCDFWKIATGGDAYMVSLTGAADTVSFLVEFSGVDSSGTFLDAVEAWTNGTTIASGSTASVASNSLILVTLSDNNESGGAPTHPGGYTMLTVSPATGDHYGDGFLMMASIGWKVSSGGTESASWTLASSQQANAGVFAFTGTGGGGGGGGASYRALTGVGR